MKRSVSETKPKNLSPSFKHKRSITTGALGFWKKLEKIKLSKKQVFIERFEEADEEDAHYPTDNESSVQSSSSCSSSSYDMLDDLEDTFEMLENEDPEVQNWSDKVNTMVKVKFGDRIKVLVDRIDQRLRNFREVSSKRLAAFSLGKPVGVVDKEEPITVVTL